MTMTAQRLNGPNLICITRKFQDSLWLFPNPPSLRKWTEFTRPHCPHCRESRHTAPARSFPVQPTYTRLEVI